MWLIKIIYKFIGAVISIIAGIVLICSSYSYLVSPEKIYHATYLSLAFPIILAVNLALLLFWIIQRNKIWAITLTSLIISAGSILLYSPLNVIQPKASGSDTLSILTYNVHYFGKLTPHNPNSPNAIIEYIKKENADIVCLQEYAFAFSNKFLGEENIDTAMAKIYPYRKLSLKRNDFSLVGIACLSKYPITSTEEIFTSDKINGASLYKVSVKERELMLFINHLESNKLSASDKKFFHYFTSHLEESDTLIDEVKRHLTWKLAAAARIRAVQADTIAARIKNLGENLIVCGDFNDTPQSYVYHKIRGNLGDAYAETGFGPGITYHADKFYFRIDHVLYGKGLKPLYTKIGETKNSDHYPIRTLFEWK